MVFEQGVYVIEHEPEKTRAFYAQASDTLCDCSGCRNFRGAISQMPQKLRAFLEQFGIDPAKPAEMSVLYAPAKDELCYNGFYHFCGEIRGDGMPISKPERNPLNWIRDISLILTMTRYGSEATANC